MLKRIYIEISNICNLQCTFCPVVERDKKVMSVDHFKKIIAQSKPLAEEVCLHLMGEPLAHPNFKEILNICEENNVLVQLTTNGIFIEKFSQNLISFKSLRQINFSVQSFLDNFPNKKIEDYLMPILNWTLKLNEHRPEVYVNFRLWNIGTEKSNEDIFSIIEKFYQVEINRKIDVGNIKSKKVWNKVYLHFDSRFDWPSMNLPFQSTMGRCHALTGHIGIHADGTVVPCCLDKEAQIPLGNCLEQSLSSILEGERASKMRIGFTQGVLVEKLCQHCSYIQRFSK